MGRKEEEKRGHGEGAGTIKYEEKRRGGLSKARLRNGRRRVEGGWRARGEAGVRLYPRPLRMRGKATGVRRAQPQERKPLYKRESRHWHNLPAKFFEDSRYIHAGRRC